MFKYTLEFLSEFFLNGNIKILEKCPFQASNTNECQMKLREKLQKIQNKPQKRVAKHSGNTINESEERNPTLAIQVSLENKINYAKFKRKKFNFHYSRSPIIKAKL